MGNPVWNILLFIVFSSLCVQAEGETVAQLFAAMNSEGFPLSLLEGAAVEAQGEGVRGAQEGEEGLRVLLQTPRVLEAARWVALRYAARKMLGSPEGGRALLAFDWADRGLCGRPWLSWLPWLACQGDGLLHDEGPDPAFGARSNEALPDGQCYADSDQ